MIASVAGCGVIKAVVVTVVLLEILPVTTNEPVICVSVDNIGGNITGLGITPTIFGGLAGETGNHGYNTAAVTANGLLYTWGVGVNGTLGHQHPPQ